MKRRRIWILSLALMILCSWISPALAQSPTDYVRGILNKVMTIQTDQALAGPAREDQRSRLIHQIIEGSFDFPMMAKDALGSTYGQIGGGQRQEFTATFSYLFQDSYARMVLKFLQKENITYNRESREGGKALVDTTIVRPNESIPVTYMMHQTGGGWLLYDVNVDGVSILNNYRTQFSQVVRSKGFGFLLERMKTQRQAIK
jgi:phospholipid transport system substrate-binding protein